LKYQPSHSCRCNHLDAFFIETQIMQYYIEDRTRHVLSILVPIGKEFEKNIKMYHRRIYMS